MAKTIVPNELKTHIIEQIVESVTEEANTSYYSFIGNHVVDAVTEDDIDDIIQSQNYIQTQSYQNMIFGKRLSESDFSFLINRYDWTSNTVYAMYDDSNENLENENFFINVLEGDDRHVYKCLFNNNGGPSTEKPILSDVLTDTSLFEVGDDYYETADGYQWKYMYTIPSTSFNKFATDDKIPVIVNEAVKQNARNGSIDVIKVEEPGKFYNNYITNTEFSEADLRINGDSARYRLPSGANTIAGFYGNTIIQMTSGSNVSGQFRNVIGSFNTPSGVVIQLDSAFDGLVLSGDKYELSPRVQIRSNGINTVNAIARAIVDSNSSNSVSKIEIIEPGLNYNFATAQVLLSIPIQGINQQATIRPIISPPGGHGSNVASELFSTSLCLQSQLSNTENGAVVANNTFAQFGIIRDPKFANVEITITKASNTSQTGSDGLFAIDASVYQFSRTRLHGNVSIQIANSTINLNDVGIDYTEALKEDQFIYITDPSSETKNLIAQVVNVSSNSFTIDKQSTWESNNAILYVAKITADGIVNFRTSEKIYLKSVNGIIEKNKYIIDADSGAIAVVAGIDVNNRIGVSNAEFDFLTFNQMTKLVGTISTQNFVADEIVYQGINIQNATTTARVHSANSTHVNLTNVQGLISTGQNLIGATSGAILSSGFDLYSGDLDPTTGTVIYLQNSIAVSRSETQSEQFRVILEF